MMSRPSGIVENNTETFINVLLLDYKASELKPETIKDTDRKVLIDASAYPLLFVSTDDEILIEGVTWHIEAWKLAPANSLWTVQIRKP